MKNKLVKKMAAVTMAAAMVMGMSVSAFADSNVYAKFCKNGTTEVSMTQMAIDGPATVVENANNTVTVTVPVDGFKYTKMGITATGYLNTLTVGKHDTATAVYGEDTDNDGYKNGTITFTIDASEYAVDDDETYIDSVVKADLTLLSGWFTKDMTSDVDLYFTSTQPVYNGK